MKLKPDYLNMPEEDIDYSPVSPFDEDVPDNQPGDELQITAAMEERDEYLDDHPDFADKMNELINSKRK